MTELNINEIEWMLFGGVLMLILLYVIGEIREARNNNEGKQETTKLEVRITELQSDLERIQHNVSSIKNLLEALRPRSQDEEEEFDIQRKGKAIMVKDKP